MAMIQNGQNGHEKESGVEHKHPHCLLQPLPLGSVLEVGNLQVKTTNFMSMTISSILVKASSTSRMRNITHKIIRAEGQIGPARRQGSREW